MKKLFSLLLLVIFLPLSVSGSNYPLHDAAEQGNCTLMEQLIAEGYDKDGKDDNGWRPLHRAAKTGDRATLEILHKLGVDIYAENNRGSTALHIAAYYNQTEACQILMRLGLDCNKQNLYGNTPLLAASCLDPSVTDAEKNYACLVALLDGGASVHVMDSKKLTPVLGVVSRGFYKSLVLLLSKGAKPDEGDDEEDTPLLAAAAKGAFECVQLLLKYGADKDGCNIGNYTPLYGAAYNNHREVAQLLIQAGANKESCDVNGYTPLHRASMYGYVQIVQLLLNNRADKETVDSEGRSALYWALVCRDLKKGDVYPETQDRYERRKQTIQALLQAGTVIDVYSVIELKEYPSYLLPYVQECLAQQILLRKGYAAKGEDWLPKKAETRIDGTSTDKLGTFDQSGVFWDNLQKLHDDPLGYVAQVQADQQKLKKQLLRLNQQQKLGLRTPREQALYRNRLSHTQDKMIIPLDMLCITDSTEA